MPTASPAWERLGEQLVRRRIEIDPRYSNRQLFADERGVNYRTISDIERGRRDNYEDATIASVEVAYDVSPGSVRRALDGGGLEPVPEPRPAPLRAVPGSRPAAPVALEVLFAMLDRHPDDEKLAAEVLAAIMSLFPDDKIITDVLGTQAEEGKPPRVIVREMREWLDFLESRSAEPQNGTSAG